MHKHIVKSVDKEIDGLKNEITTLAAACSSQLEKAATALLRLDKDLAVKVVKDDGKINALEKMIEDHAVRFLAKRQPMAVDLRFLLSAMRIAYEFERIGDSAENIAQGVVFIKSPPSDEIMQVIVNLAAACRHMIQEATDAFLTLDADKSIAVWKKDGDIDDGFDRILRLVTRQIRQSCAESFEDGTQLVLIGRNIERIGDHITNIAEDIYYIITGNNDLKGILKNRQE